MIVDTSAFVAVALREPGFQALVAAMTERPAAMSAVSALEVRIVLGSDRFALSDAALDVLFERTGIHVIEFTSAHSQAAAAAYLRFGKGNRPLVVALTWATVRRTLPPSWPPARCFSSGTTLLRPTSSRRCRRTSAGPHHWCSRAHRPPGHCAVAPAGACAWGTIASST